MTANELLAALAATMRDLTKWLTAKGVPHAVVGGVAASLLGKPRATRDVDAVILAGDVGPHELVVSAEPFGFAPLFPNAAEFAVQHRVLQLAHIADGITLDISLGILPFEEEMIARAVRVSVQGIDIPLATPEDLIVMKALAMRPNDITDIVSLIDANPKIDLGRVRQWVRFMSEAIEDPSISERLESLLKNLARNK